MGRSEAFAHNPYVRLMKHHRSSISTGHLLSFDVGSRDEWTRLTDAHSGADVLDRQPVHVAAALTYNSAPTLH